MSKIKYPIGGFAPGSYYGTCHSCKEGFLGDKLASQCETCAINSINALYVKTKMELVRLKSSLKGVLTSTSVIEDILKDDE